MKISRKNSFIPSGSLGFSIVPFQSVNEELSRAATGGASISLSYSHGAPANPSDVMPAVSRQFQIPAGSGMQSVTASGSVDDAVSMTIDGKSQSSSSGPSHPFELSIDGLAEGLHSLSVIHTNINYDPPSANVSSISGSVGPCPPVSVVPDDNEEEKPECEEDEGEDGGSPSDSSRGFRGASKSGADADYGSSSAGSRMRREAELRYMRWGASFGVFRGLGGIPSGRLEVMGYEYDATLLSPAGLRYRHPAASVVLVPAGGIAPNALFRVYEGGAYTNYVCDANGSAGFGVGSTSSKTAQAEFVSSMSRESSVVTSLAQASFLRIAKTNGTATFYNLVTGEFAGYISSQNAVLSAQEFESYLAILREEDGSIRQVWNLWDGLVDVVAAQEGVGYTIAFYLPGQVTGNDPATGLYTVVGDPFKTFTIGGDALAKTFSVTERDWTLPESTPPYMTVWSHVPGAWNLTEGTGDEAIVTTREKTTLPSQGTYRVVTKVSKGGVFASIVAEEYRSHAIGELLLSRTNGYGSPDAQTTVYEYDDAGRVAKVVAPDGGVSLYIHDAKGRATVTTSPWAGGISRLIQTTYLDDGSEYSGEPSQVDTNYLDPNGLAKLHLQEVYTYSVANQVKRVEIRSTANGITRLEVSEMWQGDAQNVYARGRMRMSQAISGVQTWYDYASTTAYGALYTVTQETRANGEAVESHSTRNVNYITAQGNTVREEAWILDRLGVWKMLSSTDQEFDLQNRSIKRTRSNGRTTTRSLMCTGNVLRETDENGILTSYSYDSARQLIEKIRAASPTVPETITSYTKDALGRILQQRTDVGPMTAIQQKVYDVMGRIVSSSDELGRTTTYAYSDNGLTTTAISPSGATLITARNTDGNIAHEYGTGQRELYHVYDYNSGRLRETVKLADQATIISQSLRNGFGESVVITFPTTTGYMYDRTTYNEKGLLTQTVRDTGSGGITMSPVLYEYDSFGNVIKETWRHDDTPTPANSRITTYTYAVEAREDGIYITTTLTKNNAAGNTYTESSSQLLSENALLENKSEDTDARGNLSSAWTEYGEGTILTQKSQLPTSSITASATIIDGVITSQSDHAGITTAQTRTYTATGMLITQTDGRGNTTTTMSDIAGRPLTVTDAAGNITTSTYCPCCNNPASITDALGNATHYKYDIRSRKLAEWGSNIQPACFTYDEANRLISLTTFRENTGDITTDPTDRTDGDTTTWEYHDATGLEICKTYADASVVRKEYNDLGLLSQKTDARSIVATYTWDNAKGVCLQIAYSDNTPAQEYFYDHLAKITQVIDASGTRSFEYNEYGEAISEAITGDALTHLVTETLDAYGRNTGYTYAKAGYNQQSVSVEYGTDGRLATTAFLHSGVQQRFSYAYLPGSHLLHTLAHPNSILITRSYEDHRDLITSINATRGVANEVLLGYTYDQLGRPITRTCSRQAQTRADNFTYNNRSELSSATLGTSLYAYDYDNIGNRKTAQEIAEEISYDANGINQYATITRGETPFIPTFDADGNQTLVQSSTGIWTVVYNAENRPISFTKSEGEQTSTIECGYDYMGRRSTKKVTVNGAITLHQRYIYREYLQIACVDLLRGGHPALWYTLWDPTEPIATRPLAIQKNGTWYTYGHDLTKNVTELYNADGTITTSYDYTPYGVVTATGTEQAFQWSSEVYDSELALTYYNYRHYNPMDGRWIGRDPIVENWKPNLYGFVYNTPVILLDVQGEWAFALPLVSIPVSLVVAVAVVATVLIAEVVRPGTIKKIVDKVIPKTNPIPIPVPNIKKPCPPCPPPQQSDSRVDCVPPSRKHYPCPGTHRHAWHYVMDQNPITCECFERKIEHPVECL